MVTTTKKKTKSVSERLPLSVDDAPEIKELAERSRDINAELQKLSDRKVEISAMLHDQQYLENVLDDDDEPASRELWRVERSRFEAKQKDWAARVLAGEDVPTAEVDNADLRTELREEFNECCRRQRILLAAQKQAPKDIEARRTIVSRKYAPAVLEEYKPIVQEMANSLMAYREAFFAEDELRHRFWSDWKVFPSNCPPAPGPYFCGSDDEMLRFLYEGIRDGLLDPDDILARVPELTRRYPQLAKD